MVTCPKCGNKLQIRKALSLSMNNMATCQVCSSRLRVKKGINGGIGFLLGWLPFGIGGVLSTIECSATYFWVGVIWTIADFFLLMFLLNKFTKATFAE